MTIVDYESSDPTSVAARDWDGPVQRTPSPQESEVRPSWRQNDHAGLDPCRVKLLTANESKREPCIVRSEGRSRPVPLGRNGMLVQPSDGDLVLRHRAKKAGLIESETLFAEVL
nr:hypothetical protein [Agromyces sp. Root81]